MLCAPYWQLAISCKHAPATHLMLYENAGSSSHIMLTRMLLMRLVVMLTAVCITSQEFHNGGYGDDGGDGVVLLDYNNMWQFQRTKAK